MRKKYCSHCGSRLINKVSNLTDYVSNLYDYDLFINKLQSKMYSEFFHEYLQNIEWSTPTWIDHDAKACLFKMTISLVLEKPYQKNYTKVMSGIKDLINKLDSTSWIVKFSPLLVSNEDTGESEFSFTLQYKGKYEFQN